MARWRWPRGVVRRPCRDSGKSLYTWRPLKAHKCCEKHGAARVQFDDGGAPKTPRSVWKSGCPRSACLEGAKSRRSLGANTNEWHRLLRICIEDLPSLLRAFAQTKRNQQQRPQAGLSMRQNDPSSERIDASALPLRTHLLPGFGTIPQLEARRFHREHAVWFLKRRTGLFYN